MNFISISDIENSFVDFDIDLTQNLSHDLTCCLSIYLTDWDNLISLTDNLTDDSAVEASTWSMMCEAEKDSILVSENRDFYV